MEKAVKKNFSVRREARPGATTPPFPGYKEQREVIVPASIEHKRAPRSGLGEPTTPPFPQRKPSVF